MGAWGYKVKQDDTVLDVIGDYDDLYMDNLEHEQVKTKLL